MPISRKEFERGELDPRFVLIEFLGSNPDYAYTADELRKELESRGKNVTTELVQSILSDMLSEGRIDLKTILDVVYYIYRKSIGFRTS